MSDWQPWQEWSSPTWSFWCTRRREAGSRQRARTGASSYDSPSDQKNFRARLKPRYRAPGLPPRASGPYVVADEFANVSENTCAPTRFSNANAYSASPGAYPLTRGDISATTNTVGTTRTRVPIPT